MASGSPTEYITLPAGEDNNFSNKYKWRLPDSNMGAYGPPTRTWSQHGLTRYKKIGIIIEVKNSSQRLLKPLSLI